MTKPTYDSKVTGPRYWVTTRVAGRSLQWRQPAADPFVRQTITLAWPDLLRGLLRGRLAVEMTVGAPDDLVSDVLDLDAQYNRRGAA